MSEGGTETRDADALAEIERLRERIAQLEERVRQLDELAHQDPLIAVPNRRGFIRELEILIASVSRYGEDAAMLFVDIDGLKQINDSFGHKAGDEALIHVATALTQGVRKTDFVARLGGDEFGILLTHADKGAALETAARLTRQLKASETQVAGNILPLGVAVGVAQIEQFDTPDAVIDRADRAMYKARSAARLRPPPTDEAPGGPPANEPGFPHAVDQGDDSDRRSGAPDSAAPRGDERTPPDDEAKPYRSFR